MWNRTVMTKSRETRRGVEGEVESITIRNRVGWNPDGG